MVKSAQLVAIASACLLLGAGSAAADQAPSCVVADHALAQDQPELAVVQYEKCLRESPPSFEVLSNLGIAYVKLGQHEQAIRAYERALALNQDSAPLYVNLGLAYLKMNQPKQAAENLARALMLNPGDPKALELLAFCHYQLKEFTLAAYEAGLVHKALPDEDSAAFLLGSAYLRLGLYKQALPLIYLSVSKTGSPEGYKVLGEAFLGAKVYREALKAFQNAERLAPNMPGIHADLGTAHAGLGETERAVTEYEKELARDPNDFEANYFLGRLKRLANETSSARKYLDKANQIRPGDTSVAYEYAVMAMGDKDYPKAAALLEGILEKQPGYLDAHILLAEVYFRMHRTQDGNREKALIDAMRRAEQARLEAERKAHVSAGQGDPAPHP
jgi:tetratricopeptide (TPR) repeat protein